MRKILFTLLVFTGKWAIAQSVTPTALCFLPAVNNESSGLERTGPNWWWSHNDSGGAASLYEFDSSGVLIKTLNITNATNIDWEDIAQGSSGEFYIGDFGNNNNNRSVANGNPLRIYIIADPDLLGTSTTATTLQFEYQDRNFAAPAANHNFDMEAFFYHDDSLHLFTKNRTSPTNGWIKHYVLPAQPGTYTAMLVDSFNNGGTRITSADMSPDGKTVCLIGQDRIYLFSCFEGTQFLSTSYVSTLTMPSTQKEAVVFGTNAWLYITDEETSSSTRRLYRVNAAPYIDAPILLSAVLDSSCVSANDGSILIAANGGTGPYTWAWSNGNTTASNSPIGPGMYTLMMNDAHGCFVDTSFTINAFPVGAITAVINSSCTNAATGSILISPSGFGPFMYSWSNGPTTALNDSIVAGNYVLQLTDGHGCWIDSSIVVGLDPALSMTALVDSSCYSSVTGSISVSPAGGSLPYVYVWSNGNPGPNNSNLGAGIYSLEITDANGCSIDSAFVLPSYSPFSVTAMIDSTCPLSNSGVIIVQPVNGNPAFAWNWSTSDTTSVISGLGQGQYNLQLTDANGCEVDTQFVVPVYNVVDPIVVLDFNLLISDYFGVNVWYLNGNLIVGETNDTLLFLQNGFYQAAHFDANGCEVISDSVAVISLAITTAESNNLTAILRTGEYCTIQNSSTGNVYISVYTLDGRTVQEVELTSGETRQLELNQTLLYLFRSEASDGRVNSVIK